MLRPKRELLSARSGAKFMLFFLLPILTSCIYGDRVWFARMEDIDIEKLSRDVLSIYKVGDPDDELVHNFTLKGYRYIAAKTSGEKERLIYPAACATPYSNINGEQIYIAWRADTSGRITQIEKPRIVSCHTTPL